MTGHLAVDAAERHPTDPDRRQIVRIGATAITGLPITEDEIYLFLAKKMFARETLSPVAEDRSRAALIPMYALANLILILSPKGMHQWTYLDVAESAIGAADKTNFGIPPLMVYRFGRRE